MSRRFETALWRYFLLGPVLRMRRGKRCLLFACLMGLAIGWRLYVSGTKDIVETLQICGILSLPLAVIALHKNEAEEFEDFEQQAAPAPGPEIPLAALKYAGPASGAFLALLEIARHPGMEGLARYATQMESRFKIMRKDVILTEDVSVLTDRGPLMVNLACRKTGDDVAEFQILTGDYLVEAMRPYFGQSF